MRNILKNRWALSTVVTTLIILVVSVLLAGVVTYFAINVTSTRVQEESLHLTKQHIYYKDSVAQATIMIINTGGRDVVIDKLTVRGQECLWTNVYYNITDDSVSDDLAFNSTLTTPTGLKQELNEVTYDFLNANTDLTIESGKTMLVYIKSPDSITVNDIGLTAAITVFTSQAMYYKECNVESS